MVGYISYTAEPLRFMTQGIVRFPIRLSWIMLRTILARPRTLADIWFMLRFMRERSREQSQGFPEDRGEVISLVAESAYQKLVPEGGKDRLTARLFRETIDWFTEQGCRSFHLLVKPENRASNIFCSVMGCRFEKIVQAGMTVHRYVYEIPEAEGSPAQAPPAGT